MRIGEALGLRHEDLAAAEREVAVVPRDNGNGARSKSRQPRLIPVSAGLIRLYADYLHSEYGSLDCDYVFVNLWGQPHGHPLGYPAVYDLVRRLRRRASALTRTGAGIPRPRGCKGAELHQMQQSAVRVGTRCLRRSGAPRPARAPRGYGDLDFMVLLDLMQR